MTAANSLYSSDKVTLMIQQMQEQALKEVAGAQNLAELEVVRLRWVGRKGMVTEAIRDFWRT